MNTAAIVALVGGFLGSNVVVAVLTNIFNKKRNTTEIANINIKAALELEARAHDRYKSASEALAAAESLLSFTRTQLQEYEEYIETLQGILDTNRIVYPPSPEGCSHAYS